jgi:hypothetical protein
MVAWSSLLSRIRKELGFLDAEEQSEDLIDVGEDEDGEVWKVVRRPYLSVGTHERGSVGYRPRYICLPDESEGTDDG